MNLKEHTFGEINMDMKTDKELLEEAKKRGFYCTHTKYNKLFSKLFFEGGTLNFKEDIDPEFKHRCFQYLKNFMTSFAPSREEKEAICALLLSELVDI